MRNGLIYVNVEFLEIFRRIVLEIFRRILKYLKEYSEESFRGVDVQRIVVFLGLGGDSRVCYGIMRARS